MIKWADKLYLGDSIKGRKTKVMRAVEANKLAFSVFCITYAVNPGNLLDIINANELSFSYYQKQEIYVIGLAGSKSEALELVRSMIEDMYRETEGFLVREYF